MYKVVTLSNDAFMKKCHELAFLVTQDVVPETLVAIKNGGSYVGAALKEIWNISDEQYFEITLQRPSTKAKKGIFFKIICKLPTPILDLLRIAEATILSALHSKKKENFELSNDLLNRLTNSNGSILIVDDAIDSGATMFAIVSEVRKHVGNRCIKIAAITQTSSSPAIAADYALYQNHTLIRFPWSADKK